METELSKTLTDISACDREAIQHLGAVQNHGCLLTFTNPEWRVTNASRSAEKFFDFPLKEIIGTRLNALLAPELMDAVTLAIAEFPWGGARGRHLRYDSRRPVAGFDAYLFRADDLFVLELEHLSPGTVATDDHKLKEFMSQARELKSAEGLGRLLCRSIRQLTGLDRVMLYKFIPPAMHGQVLAEDKVAEAHSYLQHRFPSSDIPRNARELYLRNQVRLIPDVQAETSPIEPKFDPYFGRPLDLSDSRLRAVSPVHLEYLHNMKVRASFSVAINCEGKLWGLIACHHMQPAFLTQSVRTACEVIAQIFAIHVASIEAVANRDERLIFGDHLRELIARLAATSDPVGELVRDFTKLAAVFSISGVAVVSEKHCDFAGVTPPRAELQVLASALSKNMQNEQRDSLELDSLAEMNSQWASWRKLGCGVMAIRLPEADDALLLMFRPEIITTVTWGGDPRKQLERRSFEGRVNPRESFVSWNETVVGHSDQWKDFEVEGLKYLREIVFDGLLKKNRLIRELGERIKS